MRYLKYTYVDVVTSVPVTDAIATNGPVEPAVEGLKFGFALESEYPTSTPVMFGTFPDGTPIDVPGVLSELTEAEYQAALDAELLARSVKTMAGWPSQIAARRFKAEESGITWNGYGVATDRPSQNKITQEDIAVNRGLRTDGSGWKCLDLSTGVVVFRPTSDAEIQQLAAAVYLHVSSSFKREAELLTAVADGSITAAMLEQGWPV